MHLFPFLIGAVALNMKNNKNSSILSKDIRKILTLLKPPSFSYEEKIELINKIKAVLEGHKKTISKIIMKSLFKPINEIEKEFEAVFKLLNDARGMVFIKQKIVEKPILAIMPFDTPVLSFIKIVLHGLISGKAVVIKPSSWATEIGEYMFALLRSVVGKQNIALLIASGKDLKGIIDPSHLSCVYIGGAMSVVTSFESEYSGRVLAEGGKGTVAVVAPDADIDQVVGETVQHSFAYNGQYCSSQKGLVIPERIREAVISSLKEKTERFFIPGKPTDGATTATPLVDNSDAWYSYTQISDAVAEGAELIFGGDQPKENAPFKPVIMIDLRADHKLVNEDYRIPYLWVSTYKQHPDDFLKQIVKEKRVVVYGAKGSLVSRLKATTGWEVLDRNEISGFLNWEGDNPYKWLESSLANQ